MPVSVLDPSARITIGIDARAAAEVPAGRGRVVRELLRALSRHEDDGHRYVLYARETWAPEELDERFRWHLIDARDPWWHLRAARAANRECAVFLSSNSYLTTWFLRIPAVPIVYDLVTFEEGMRPNRRSQVIERLTLGHAVRRSAALLAISQATADALIAHFPAAASCTVVAPLGVTSTPAVALDPAETSALPPAGFVLAVGTLEPRKNLPRLVAAYGGLPEELQDRHPLVVVGALGWETGETLDSLQSLGDRAAMLGYVSDAALAELYRRCTVFCYPSLGEGFGLPVLEAMAAGAPVITSNLSSLPEVGGTAAEYVDPHDVTSIADGLERTLSDEHLRSELAQRGRARAAQFTWQAFAVRVLEILDEAVRRPT
jgi:glycosyltransferase involved in cell wall biosynthesis